MSELLIAGRRALETFRSLSGLLDLLLVWALIYTVLSALRGAGTRRWRGVGVGVSLLAVAWLATSPERGLVQLDAFHWLLTALAPPAALAAVVVFQPEIRQSMHQIGQWSPFGTTSGGLRSEILHVVTEVLAAAEQMVVLGRGALFVIQRRDGLREIVETGQALDAQLSSELLTTIYYDATPLHDGAVVIINDRVAAAGCLLPLSERRDIARELGTRHRAALGLTERSDALVVVVSEETGLVSIAVAGTLLRHLSGEVLRLRLIELLQPGGPDQGESA